MVFTFSNHPLSVVAPERVPVQIGDNISKAAFLEEMGVDLLLNVAFSEKLSKQTPEEFLERLKDFCIPLSRYNLHGKCVFHFVIVIKTVYIKIRCLFKS